MPEDLGDKTEAPTPKRRQEAREQGNIPRSPDLTAAVLLISVMLLLNSFGPGLVGALKALVADLLGAKSMADSDATNAALALMKALISIGLAMAPFFIGIIIIAILVNVIQTGLHFSGAKLQPNFAALNPFKGLGKIFSGGAAKMQFLMNLLKLTLVSLTAYSAVHGRLEQIVTVQQLSFVQIFGLGAGIIYSIAIRIGILLLVLALIDYFYQRYRIEKELKMTKQEVKEEMRRMEGDPMIKQRRRQIQMQVARERIKKDVPTADVVVTNPTHYAIALKYDATTMRSPRVIAKGQGVLAMRIREIAVAHGVPILERPPLARALFKLVEVGQEIPEQFYSAVAEILAYVYELSGKIRRKQTA
jgi:flagellar biosynthetic protein FlhB